MTDLIYFMVLKDPDTGCAVVCKTNSFNVGYFRSAETARQHAQAWMHDWLFDKLKEQQYLDQQNREMLKL